MFTAGNIIAIAVALFGFAVTWGGVLWRIGRVEKDVEDSRKSVDERIREFQAARERQGERIGEVEWEIARLGERVGMASSVRKRKLTKPAGEG